MIEFADFNEMLKESGLTKKKLAELCSVDVTTITRWCKRSDLVPSYAYHILSQITCFLRYELKRSE